MIISAYSALSAICWFAVFLIVGDKLRERTGLLSHYNFFALLTMMALSIVRLMLPIELFFTKVIRSQHMIPWLITIFFTPVHVGKVPISLFSLIITVWCSGILYTAIRLFLRLRHDKILIDALYPVEDAIISNCIQDIAKQTKPKRYRLIVTPDVSSPVVVGVWTPILLFPPADKESKNLNMQIIHEWQHVLNRDQQIKLLVSIIGCIMWWLPAARRMDKSIDSALEIRCDLNATKKMTEQEKKDYLRALIMGYDQAHMQQQAREDAFSSMACRLASATSTDEAVMERLNIIKSHKSGTQKSVVAFFVIACIVFVLSFTFVFQPFYPVPEVEFPGHNGMDSVEFTPENAYIEVNEDRYYVVHESGFTVEVPAELIDIFPFKDLTRISK